MLLRVPKEMHVLLLYLMYAFSSPEPVVSWSRGRERRGRLQIKPSGSGDENAHLW